MSKKRRGKRGEEPSGNAGVDLTSEQRRQIVQAQVSATFSGPLPHPEILIRYNDAVPDAAERIIAMAERQSAHRIELESRVVDADIRRANLGLVAGLIIALAFLIGAIVLILSGYTAEGTILGTVDIVGLAGTFVYGTERRRKEREERARFFAGQ